MNPKKYNWDELLSLPRFVFRRSVDYHCSPMTIAQQIRNAAHARGKGVEIDDEGGGDLCVTVRNEPRPYRKRKNAVVKD